MERPRDFLSWTLRQRVNRAVIADQPGWLDVDDYIDIGMDTDALFRAVASKSCHRWGSCVFYAKGWLCATHPTNPVKNKYSLYFNYKHDTWKTLSFFVRVALCVEYGSATRLTEDDYAKLGLTYAWQKEDALLKIQDWLANHNSAGDKL